MDDEKLVFKTVDEFLQDKDFSDLMQKSKIPTSRRFVSQVVSFYKCFLKKLLTSELATSSFARGLSSFDEVVVKVGNSAHYTDSIQLPCGYFVQQKWIAPSVKPVIVSEYCSLVTKFRLDKVDNGSEEWVSFFSRYYELQSRAELFRLFRICCETLRSPCQAPPLFTVSLVGLKSDVSEFNSAARSLQCSIASIQKIESLFLASASLPRAFALLDQGPGLMHKRKFSMWNLLSSSYFHKIGIRASLEACYKKSSVDDETIWLSIGDSVPSRSSSATSTPSKTSPEKPSTSKASPVVRRLFEVPVFPDVDPPKSGEKKEKKKGVFTPNKHN